MESGSIKKELLDFFKFSSDTSTASVFAQQRSKLLLETWAFLFHGFNDSFTLEKKYNGYQLLACDGSDLNIARNPEDKDTYFHSIPTDKGFNQFHLTQMIDRYSGGKKTIFIADGGYETYNIFAHVQEKDRYYLIRVKDGGGGKMT